MDEDRFINYSDQLFLNVADELNVKEVRLVFSTEPLIEAVYHYDTIKGESHGFTVELDGKEKEAPSTLIIILTKYFMGNILADMQKVRDLVSIGLNQRAKAGVKVRQPLQSLTLSWSL